MVQALRPKVGLLALTLELYETLAPGLREQREKWVRQTVLPALQDCADVSFARAVCRREEIEAVVAGYEREQADALLVILLTYSPSQLALPALQHTQLPILVWNTQELFSVDDGFNTAAMIGNHGVHGTQDLCNALLRSGVKFEYSTSHLRDPKGLKPLADFFVAAASVHRLHRLRLGLLGFPFPGMGDFALDTTHLTATLGCEWVNLPLEDYILRASGAKSDAVQALAGEYKAAYDVAANVSAEDLEATARVELALRGMLQEHRLGGFTCQFLAFGADARTPTVPFVATSRLMAEGMGFGGEGDLISAAGNCLLNWLNPPASFTEMFTIDFAGNSVFLSHMGEANVAMAPLGAKVRLVARSTPITRTLHRQLVLLTTFRPGPATFCSLTLGPCARWRLIAARGELKPFGPLPAMEVPQAKFAPCGDVRSFLTAYATHGGPHHAAVCQGDACARLQCAARLLDADYFEI